jgi:hypothetical protein
MKLFEHPDFEQAIIRAAEHFHPRGLRESILEKDYFVTEALRIFEQAVGDKVIFKGGTSLSKGWDLIQRFSEDIDIFLDPTAFTPLLGKKAIDRELKKLRQAIERHPGLNYIVWPNGRKCWRCATPSTARSRPTTTASAASILRRATWPRPA